MRDAMSRLMGRRTMLVIGHRLSTVRSADRVVVLDNGRIVEMGTPSALLRVGTRFHELFAAQADVVASSTARKCASGGVLMPATLARSSQQRTLTASAA